MIFKLLITLISAFALWNYRGVFPKDSLHNSAAAFAGISATLLGFTVAALSILTAMLNQRLLKIMVKTGHYGKLLNELCYTAVSFGLVTFLSLINIFLIEPYATIGMITTISVMIFSTLMMASAGLKFWKILSNFQG
jgi:hypothetical protein